MSEDAREEQQELDRQHGQHILDITGEDRGERPTMTTDSGGSAGPVTAALVSQLPPLYPRGCLVR